MSNFHDSVIAVVDDCTVAVTKMLTCMANAFRATEIGPFSASQAAISEETKNKMSPFNRPLFSNCHTDEYSNYN